MGLFGNSKKQNEHYQNVPDEQLNFNQKHHKKWWNDEPFYTASDLGYSPEGRGIIDARLNASLGLNNIDDLIEMKAPRFYSCYRNIDDNVYDIGQYIQKNLPNNNKLQELKGENNQLKKQCADQKAMIEKLMTQNERLQNQLLEKINAQSNTQSSSFSR